jgi:hypothetical protein
VGVLGESPEPPRGTLLPPDWREQPSQPLAGEGAVTGDQLLGALDRRIFVRFADAETRDAFNAARFAPGGRPRGGRALPQEFLANMARESGFELREGKGMLVVERIEGFVPPEEPR